MILFDNVSKKFNDDLNCSYTLENISFEIKEGECIGIVGKSGEGKSTLLSMINGLKNPTSGTIYVSGKTVDTTSTKNLYELRKDVSMVFQNHALVLNLTAEENILLPKKFGTNIDQKNFESIVELMGIGDKLKKYPSKLSGGEKQRVAIARALVTRPKVLLCDEITASLDDNTTIEILNLICEVNKKYNTTIVFVSHNLSNVKFLSDRIMILDNHKIVDILPNKHKGLNNIKHQKYIDYVREVIK